MQFGMQMGPGESLRMCCPPRHRATIGKLRLRRKVETDHGLPIAGKAPGYNGETKKGFPTKNDVEGSAALAAAIK